ncbi:MAG: glycoside hydrolase family protein [Leptolyngbya sp. SIO4C1]|nr:glycoside hydrolase family protein [Leptolyngbya sp. SIO4C1]
MFVGVILVLFRSSGRLLWPLVDFSQPPLLSAAQSEWVAKPEPLAMSGGNPYLRALMRTISAGESNTARPYHLLYGGQMVRSLKRHPDQCIEITVGPNQGDCTTAAGRYQFLTTTWYAKARRYHPNPVSNYLPWKRYRFDPASQDQVVHDWLADSGAWGVDIAQLLYEGEIDYVLQLLSSTWTSLGYGIETNSMSAYLPAIYDEMLVEELAQTE